MTEAEAPPAPLGATLALSAIVAELRRLAVAALDAGHPLAAAEIAGAADRLEIRGWPPRPDYGPP
jgi:hypothetical protein